MGRARGYRWREVGLVENDRKTCNRIEVGNELIMGLWLKATSFLGNRSLVHAIILVGGGSWQYFSI